MMTEPRTEAGRRLLYNPDFLGRRSPPMTDSPYNWTNCTAAWHHWHHGVCLNHETPESAALRIRQINTIKPKAERPGRLLRFKPADLSSIPELSKANAACDKADAACAKAACDKADAARDKAKAAWEKANAAWDKAYAAWVKAKAAWEKANDANLPAILALHAEQCGCRWTPEHPSIFEDDHD